MAPTFAIKPSIQQTNETTLVFHCSIVADPRPSISWFRNGVKVQDDPKFQVLTKEVNGYTFDCSLFLSDVTVEDAGKYKVTARNDLGESNATISLNFDSDEVPVPKNGVRPTFTGRPVIRQTEDDARIVFECKLVGDPLPEISWYHNETKISASRRHKFKIEESENKLFYICFLEILDVEASDAGTYKAVARSSMGEGHATINLNFEEGFDIGNTPKIPDGVPPRFPKKPSIRQEGDNLIMECLLEAHPFPEITWYRGEKSIKENKRIRYECATLRSHRYLLTLTIKNPTLADGGMYRCNAFNPCGDSNANIDLNFDTGDDEEDEQRAPGDMMSDGLPPTFTEKPRIIPNPTGTLVTMKFRIKSRPKSEMQWYKGNHKIKEGSKFRSKYIEIGEDEYEIILEINNPTADDGGDYKCIVKNDLGQLQAKLNLNIEAEPVTPTPPAQQKATQQEASQTEASAIQLRSEAGSEQDGQGLVQGEGQNGGLIMQHEESSGSSSSSRKMSKTTKTMKKTSSASGESVSQTVEGEAHQEQDEQSETTGEDGMTSQTSSSSQKHEHKKVTVIKKKRKTSTSRDSRESSVEGQRRGSKTKEIGLESASKLARKGSTEGVERKSSVSRSEERRDSATLSSKEESMAVRRKSSDNQGVSQAQYDESEQVERSESIQAQRKSSMEVRKKTSVATSEDGQSQQISQQDGQGQLSTQESMRRDSKSGVKITKKQIRIVKDGEEREARSAEGDAHQEDVTDGNEFHEESSKSTNKKVVIKKKIIKKKMSGKEVGEAASLGQDVHETEDISGEAGQVVEIPIEKEPIVTEDDDDQTQKRKSSIIIGEETLDGYDDGAAAEDAEVIVTSPTEKVFPSDTEEARQSGQFQSDSMSSSSSMSQQKKISIKMKATKKGGESDDSVIEEEEKAQESQPEAPGSETTSSTTVSKKKVVTKKKIAGAKGSDEVQIIDGQEPPTQDVRGPQVEPVIAEVEASEPESSQIVSQPEVVIERKTSASGKSVKVVRKVSRTVKNGQVMESTVVQEVYDDGTPAKTLEETTKQSQVRPRRLNLPPNQRSQ
ncbi:twitchin-like [Tigriopus californicus]|uniref:twitchin-like n=1 Tax=Tigriopus californicus TaxID=6832 RepID=UPI0027DA0324|nr:twitchin-like [Tigriopus californicus]